MKGLVKRGEIWEIDYERDLVQNSMENDHV